MTETETFTLCEFSDHCLHSLPSVEEGKHYCCRCPGVVTFADGLDREEKTHGGFHVGPDRVLRPGYPVEIEVPTPRTGDSVYHLPSKERWRVAWANPRMDQIGPEGWPETIAKLSDCSLLRRASDEEHARAVREWVEKTTPIPADHRRQRVIRLHGGRGGVKDVSWSVYCTGSLDGNDITLGDWSGTHNFNDMIRAAGFVDWLDCFEGEGIRGRDLEVKLEGVLNRIERDPDHVRAHEPSNGWGTLEQLVPILQEMCEKCRLFPSSTWTLGSR